VKLLSKMCAARALLPRSLQTEIRYDPSRVAHYRGGFADVWKGECHGLEVAVKVLRVYVNSDLQKMTHVSRPRISAHFYPLARLP